MPSARSLFHLSLAIVVTLAAVQAHQASAQNTTPEKKTTSTPWGLSSSAGSTRNAAEWLPKVAAAGVTTVRMFPEWRNFEPKTGTWNWTGGDALVKAATDNRIEINAILMGAAPEAKAVHAFPMENLDGWSNYVSKVVERYKDRVHYWEVWNEGNGGFNDGKHTTVDYAQLAIRTYEAAKQADPNAQVGLTVASYDAPYLQQTILAMQKAKKPNSFDYLCIHPYEIADGLAGVDGEIPYLWMTHSLREMLKVSAPEKVNAEIWITEVGHRIGESHGQKITDHDAAIAFAKIYVMAIAQGIARTQWFEAQDPIGEDAGFGLISRDGKERPSYRTLKTLSSKLGSTPAYQGWLAVGQGGRGYGFVFGQEKTPVLVAWMPSGLTDASLSFPNDVEVTDLLSTTTITLRAGQPLGLTDEPLLIEGVPSDLVTQARSNAGKNFPWGGDFSKAKSVSLQLGSTEPSQGIFPTGRTASPSVTFPDGSIGIVVQGDISHGVSFYVHPSFASLQTRDYYIRVTARRFSAGNVGMNLIYEVADSQGHGAYSNAGKWFGANAGTDWQTYTWHVTDACFSKMWGYDIVVRPEESVPFAIGNIEVSTVPFE